MRKTITVIFIIIVHFGIPDQFPFISITHAIEVIIQDGTKSIEYVIFQNILCNQGAFWRCYIFSRRVA